MKLDLDFALKVISVLAFLMSGATWIKTIAYSRKKFILRVLDFTMHADVIQFKFMLQNNSSLPISVSSFELCQGDLRVACESRPKKISVETAPYETVITKTAEMPVNLNPYEGRSFHAEFLHCRDIRLGPEIPLIVRICTNRGPVSKSLTFAEMVGYQRKKSQ